MANFESFRAVVSERFSDHERSIIEGSPESIGPRIPGFTRHPAPSPAKTPKRPAFDRLGIGYWRRRASIPVPLVCETSALPFELRPRLLRAREFRF